MKGLTSGWLGCRTSKVKRKKTNPLREPSCPSVWMVVTGRGSNGLYQIYQRSSFKTHTSWLSSLAALVNIRGEKGRHAPFKELNYSFPSLFGIEIGPGDQCPGETHPAGPLRGHPAQEHLLRQQLVHLQLLVVHSYSASYSQKQI